MLETKVRLYLKAKCIDSLLCYISFIFTLALCVLFSYSKKWLSNLSLVISPYLHRKLVNWTSAFCMRFVVEYWLYYYSLWTGLVQLFVFINYILWFLLCNFTSYGVYIEQTYYSINLYFFCCLCGTSKVRCDMIFRAFVGLS